MTLVCVRLESLFLHFLGSVTGENLEGMIITWFFKTWKSQGMNFLLEKSCETWKRPGILLKKLKIIFLLLLIGIGNNAHSDKNFNNAHLISKIDM